jgi:hypothetical protein
MNIECLVCELDTEILKWANAEILWEELKLGNFCWPSDAMFFERVEGLEVLIYYPELKGWDTIDPGSHEAEVWISNEEVALKAFYVAMIELAYEHREDIASSIAAKPEADSGEDDLHIHAGASGFRRTDKD